MNKLKVAVAMGGRSAEREVSIKSGNAVLGALDPDCYESVSLVWLADGTWSCAGGEPVGADRLASFLVKSNIDVVFIALHGPGGEDGTIQGFLELLNIPYTGPGVAASAIAMDKIATRAVLQQSGLRCAPAIDCDRESWNRSKSNIYEKSLQLGRPIFVKAPTQGSSFGVTRVATEERAEFELAVDGALRFGMRVLIEKGISGIEVTAPTLGNSHSGELLSLSPVEIRPRSKSYFDFEEKYAAGGAREICPPESLTKEQIARIQQLGAAAHRALQCDGMSRTDMIVTDTDITILEVNTIPGLTERSLLPQAAAASGIPFPKLVSMIIEFAVARGESWRAKHR